jgi:hypothetical protein
MPDKTQDPLLHTQPKRKEYSQHWEEGGKPIADDDQAHNNRKFQYTNLVNDYVSWFTGFLYFVLYFTPLILTLIT